MTATPAACSCGAPATRHTVATAAGDVDVIICHRCDRRRCPGCNTPEATGTAQRCSSCGTDCRLTNQPG